MKEQVILERDEYLKLKQLADLSQKNIDELKCNIKGTFLRNIFSNIYTGVFYGYNNTNTDSDGDSDWPDVENKWSNWLRYLKDSIERENWDDALNNIQHTIKEIVKEYREEIYNKEMTNHLYNQMKEFYSIPWYKRLFIKLK